jgi:formamidopyrimidine-DNA glycosylase
LYQSPGEDLPKKYHLAWQFADGSSLSYTLRMWGAVKLLESEVDNYIPDEESGVPPLHPEFTFERFDQMLNAYPDKTRKGIKGFLVATGYAIPDPINGLGNAIVQDILYNANLNPKRKIPDIQTQKREDLFNAIQETIQKAIDLGGRYDEVDLFGNKGRYIRLMDSKSTGNPCSRCGTEIQKISYLGGACYVCPTCQT